MKLYDEGFECGVRAGMARARAELLPRPADEHPRDGSVPPRPNGPNELRACWCYRCLDAPGHGLQNPVVSRMVVCPACGNKRCPRATDHRFACTDSNEPEQFGSRYGAPVMTVDQLGQMPHPSEAQPHQLHPETLATFFDDAPPEAGQPRPFDEIYEEQRRLDAEGPFPSGTPRDDGGRISDEERALLYFSSRMPDAVARLAADFAYVRRAGIREERARVALLRPSDAKQPNFPCDECNGRGWHHGECHPREECGHCAGTGDLLSDAALRSNLEAFATCNPRYEKNATFLRELSREVLRLRSTSAIKQGGG